MPMALIAGVNQSVIAIPHPTAGAKAGKLQWTCQGAKCTAQSDQTKNMAVNCKKLARQAGPIARFQMNNQLLDPQALTKCNTFAKAGKKNSQPVKMTDKPPAAPGNDPAEKSKATPQSGAQVQPSQQKVILAPSAKSQSPQQKPKQAAAPKAGKSPTLPPSQNKGTNDSKGEDKDKSFSSAPPPKTPSGPGTGPTTTSGGANRAATDATASRNFAKTPGAKAAQQQMTGLSAARYAQIKASFDRDKSVIEALQREEQRRIDERERRRGTARSDSQNTNAFTSWRDFDCNDTDITVRPNGTEVCNHKDDDCDANIDWVAGRPIYYSLYLDADGDGAGDPDAEIEWVCPQDEAELSRSSGHAYSRFPIDCDDSDPTKYNAATCVETGRE